MPTGPKPRAAAELRPALAISTRWKGAWHPETIELRRQLTEAKIREYVAQQLAASPPLTDEQLDRIADTFRRTERGEV